MVFGRGSIPLPGTLPQLLWHNPIGDNMDNMPFAGTLVSFNQWVDDDNGRTYEGMQMTGYVTSRNRAMNTMRVCVGTGDYYTVTKQQATAI
jgi:hypothetical protein